MNKRNTTTLAAAMAALDSMIPPFGGRTNKPAYEPTPEELARRAELEQEKTLKAGAKRERRRRRNLCNGRGFHTVEYSGDMT